MWSPNKNPSDWSIFVYHNVVDLSSQLNFSQSYRSFYQKKQAKFKCWQLWDLSTCGHDKTELAFIKYQGSHSTTLRNSTVHHKYRVGVKIELQQKRSFPTLLWDQSTTKNSEKDRKLRVYAWGTVPRHIGSEMLGILSTTMAKREKSREIPRKRL